MIKALEKLLYKVILKVLWIILEEIPKKVVKVIRI